MTLLLGLIGDNIAASQAPRLHRLAGGLAGVAVRYDRLVPREMGMTFEQVLAQAQAQGYRGVNVTYPYKERAAARVRVDDPLVRAMGAVNTVVFAPGGSRGFNTDYTGFVAAYRGARGDAPPGTVALIGAGGVGKAAAFGLIRLGAASVRIADTDGAKAEALARALRDMGADARAVPDAETAAQGATGLINCTPLGMEGVGGTPLPKAAMHGADWAFDAVYTPENTLFLTDAAAAGLQVISGYELFFGQGVDAWYIFAGLPIEPAALRAALRSPDIGG